MSNRAYDKSVRDIETIGNLEGYLKAYPVFANYPPDIYGLGKKEECLDSVAESKLYVRKGGQLI